MRDKLIELIRDFLPIHLQHHVEGMADHLISHGVTVQQWIPVSERLPEEDDRVLAWNGKGLVQMCRFQTRYSIKHKRLKTGFYTDGNKKLYTAKYWITTPKTPEGETR